MTNRPLQRKTFDWFEPKELDCSTPVSCLSEATTVSAPVSAPSTPSITLRDDDVHGVRLCETLTIVLSEQPIASGIRLRLPGATVYDMATMFCSEPALPPDFDPLDLEDESSRALKFMKARSMNMRLEHLAPKIEESFEAHSPIDHVHEFENEIGSAVGKKQQRGTNSKEQVKAKHATKKSKNKKDKKAKSKSKLSKKKRKHQRADREDSLERIGYQSRSGLGMMRDAIIAC